MQVSKIEVLKTSVQFTSDANQVFSPSRASMSNANELVNVTSSAFIINSAVQGQQRTVDKLAIKLSQYVIKDSSLHSINGSDVQVKSR